MDAQAEFPPASPAAGRTECPLCRGEIHPDAIRCPHCTTLLSHFKICPRCAEKVHEDAQLCRFCQYDFEREAERQKMLRTLEANPHRLAANPLGVLFTEMSITGLFFPPELEIRGSDVILRRWSLFGLRRLDQRIPIRRIASARMLTGVIWGGLMIETFGGALSDMVMHGLDRQQAAETAALLERITVKD